MSVAKQLIFARGFRASVARVALVAGVLAPATVVRADETISIYLNQPYQIFDGFGGNMARAREDQVLDRMQASGTDLVGEFCFANLTVKHVRIGMPLIVFEPTRGTFDYTATNVVHVFNLMRYLTQNSIPFSMGIWNLPDWMVYDNNPSDPGGRFVKTNTASINYDYEVANCIKTFLNYAANHGGGAPDGISFNESTETWGNDIAMPVAKLNAIMTELGKIKSSVKWILNDTGANKGDSYARACWYGNASGEKLSDANKARVIAVSYHGWKSELNRPLIGDLRAFAEEIGKPLWCLEVGEDPVLSAGDLDTWTYASRLAKNYFYAFKDGHVTKADYWEYMKDFRLTTTADGTAFTRAGHVVEMLNDLIRPGMTMFNSAGLGNGGWPLAFKHVNDGRVRVFFINTSGDQKFTIKNLPAGTYTWTRCSNAGTGEDNKVIGTYPVGTDGNLVLNSVPGDSINIVSKPVD